MKHLFAPHNIALAAKEKGFDEKCLAYFVKGEVSPQGDFVTDVRNSKITPTLASFYSIDSTAPLYAQLISWLQKEHGILIYPKYQRFDSEPEYWIMRSGAPDFLCGTIDKSLEVALATINFPVPDWSGTTPNRLG